MWPIVTEGRDAEPKIGILSYAIEPGKGTREDRRIVRNEGSRVGNRARGITRRCARNRTGIGPNFGPYIGTRIKGGISYTEKRRCGRRIRSKQL